MKKRTSPAGALFASCLFLTIAVVWICADTLFGASLFGGVTGRARDAVSVTIPRLIGQLYSDSLPDTSDLFDYSVTYVYSAEDARQVLDQSPAPGTRRKVIPGVRRAELHLTVSMGQPVHVVPGLMGLSRVEAEKALRDADLTPIVRVCTDATLQQARHTGAGHVLRTDPPAGTQREAGSSVVLYILPDQPRTSARCPSLVGLDVVTAREELAHAGLCAGNVTFTAASDILPGTVLEQSIAPGSFLVPGTAVGLCVTVFSIDTRYPGETDGENAPGDLPAPERTSPVFP